MKTIPKSALRFMRLQQVGYEHAQAAFEEDFEIEVLTGRIACQYKKPYDSGLPSDERAIYYIRLPFDSSKVIVSRHPGIVEWFRKYKGIVDAPIVATARPKDVKGKIVYTSGINVGLLKYAQGAILSGFIEWRILTLILSPLRKLKNLDRSSCLYGLLRQKFQLTRIFPLLQSCRLYKSIRIRQKAEKRISPFTLFSFLSVKLWI